jgi:Leucine-rich repeat (LRR) protein
VMGGCHDAGQEVWKPLTKEESANVIEGAIRLQIKKPEGELTEADLEKVGELYLDDKSLTSMEGLEKCTQLWNLDLNSNQLTDVKGLENLTQLEVLDLDHNQLTDVKGLEKLTQLTLLYLENNPDLTKAQIDELKKALPKCNIFSNPTK